VQDRWQTAEADGHSDALVLRAYSSRLIGADTDLVLHGGGNTSVKQDGVLYVKGTGRNLAAVTPDDFTPLDLKALQKGLSGRERNDTDLMSMVDSCLLRPDAPRPSIETYMHAAIDHPYVEHAHADAVLALFNIPDPESLCRSIFGNRVRVVPYRHSGIALGRACSDAVQDDGAAEVIGLILAYHGVVAFGGTAESSYRNLLTIVNTAEDWLRQRGAWQLPEASGFEAHSHDEALQDLCSVISLHAGMPLDMKRVTTPLSLAFANHPALQTMATQGPPTPQHAVYAKRIPLIGRNVAQYVHEYTDYLKRHLGDGALERLDPAPRVVVDPRFGVCAFGVNAHYAAVTAEIFSHDMAIMLRAQAHAGYRAASPGDIARAELEYSGFEQPFRQTAHS
jgi:rhamnose utilization protein RhaD (predicted bifunctional aldolase and dehydrogenase)